MLYFLLITVASSLLIDSDSQLQYHHDVTSSRVTYGLDNNPSLECSTSRLLLKCVQDDVRYLPGERSVIVHHKHKQVCQYRAIEKNPGEFKTEFVMCFNLQTNRPIFPPQ
ncbi:hypothetical protein DSO57_1022798 [Entomophthora muscae]|uniref:Uncharacterized protein n=1 Tax=Entomophthora muscae TaxID=34485 RepID=A0ACC2TE13_9FUNG|nr:hypothetical protein DSO57_1022798 [Entomophthora muscae]